MTEIPSKHRVKYLIASAVLLGFIGTWLLMAPDLVAATTGVNGTAPFALGVVSPIATPIVALISPPNSGDVPAPVAMASWRARTSDRVPILMQRTVGTAQGGGGGLDTFCPFDNPPSVPAIWEGFEDISVTKYPGVFSFTGPAGWLEIWTCIPDLDPSLKVTLYWPDGRQLELPLTYREYGSAFGGYAVEGSFQFTWDMPAGDYVAQIRDQFGLSARLFRYHKMDYLESYHGPRFKLRGKDTPEERFTFGPGETIELDYSDFASQDQVEVGLYALNDAAAKFELQNSWVFTTSSEGHYADELVIPDDAKAGIYAIVAGQLAPITVTVEDSPQDTFVLGGIGSGFEIARERIPASRIVNKYFQVPFAVSDSPPLLSANPNGGSSVDVTDDPTEATREYYGLLNLGVSSGDFHAAYDLLSRNRREQRSYEELKELYADTYAVEAEEVTLLDQTPEHAVVHVVAKLIVANGTARKEDRYDIIYQLVMEDGRWRMDEYERSIAP